jgi:hypothetical protein
MSHSYQQQLPKLPLVPPRTCSKPIFSYAGWLTSSLSGSFSHRAASFSKESIQNSIQVQVLVILGKLSSWAERQLELVVARLHWFSLQQKHCSRSRRRRKRRSSLKKKKKSWKLLSETLGSCIYRPKKNTSLQKEKPLSPDTKYLSLSLFLSSVVLTICFFFFFYILDSSVADNVQQLKTQTPYPTSQIISRFMFWAQNAKPKCDHKSGEFVLQVQRFSSFPSSSKQNTNLLNPPTTKKVEKNWGTLELQ